MKVMSTPPSDEWTPLNPSAGFTWTVPGATLVGVWLGSTTGEKGPRGVLQADTGEVIRFTLPVSLRQQVGELDPGTRCKIVYTGDRLSRRMGRSYKAFTVLVARKDGQ
jgi:hypothetical protein